MAVTFDEFLQGICDSGLMTTEQLAEFRASLPASDNNRRVETLARRLIEAGKLTPYQAKRIASGNHAGLILGKHVIEDMIGEGGAGTVYRARHVRMKRQIAVKVLHSASSNSDYSIKRFQREVQTAARLSHPNIVTAYDADEDQGFHFLVMEYVPGEDLRTLIEREGPLPLAKAVNIIVQACKGLHYAHKLNIVHRDIKPGNLLIDRQGRVKILDMGLAHFDESLEALELSDDEELTAENQIIGTVDFMSPEQADNSKSVDARSDVYSLGCTLYYLLTGSPPYYRSSLIKTLIAHRADKIPSLKHHRKDLPDEVDRIFAKMVAKEPANRLGSMAEVIRVLRRFDDDSDFAVGESVQFSVASADSDSDTKVLDPSEVSDDLSSRLPAPSSSKTDQHDSIGTGVDRIDTAVGAPDSLMATVVGIDLGTTFSVVAHLDDLGRPQTLMNAEGDKITPSVLLFDSDEVIVGKEAIKAMATEMEMIAECAKRDLGQRAYHKVFGQQQYPPEVLLAYILRKLRADAEAQVGEVNRAVITVPAYFDEVRRKATQDAGYLAGLEVMDIINEPTAAAVAYGFRQGMMDSETGNDRKREDTKSRVLVYDLGGGTFDVTVMEIRGDQFVTLATDGDVQLGGRDWDQRLVDHVADQFFQQHGVDPRFDSNALGRLWRECEDAKRTLSTRQKTAIGFDYKGLPLRIEVTRAQFEEMTFDLLGRTEFTTRQTLEDAKLQWSQVDRILLVGGSTRMPAVSEMLKKLSGIEPDRSISPDEAVAHGAALHAGILVSRYRGRKPKFRVRNVNSHSLGVVGVNPKNNRKQAGVLIRRNTPIPATARRVFRTKRDDQRSIVVQIVEGESSQPEECSQVGMCVVRDLPAGLPAKTPVHVSFHYRENGRLLVSVKIKNKEIKQELVRENSMTREQLDRWRLKISGRPAAPFVSPESKGRWR